MSAFRVSDQEREAAAQQLREHFAAGRISEAEFDQRVQAAFEAQTDEQLRTLTADLPKLPASPAQRKAEVAARRSQLQRRLLQEAGGGLTLFAICTVIWLASGVHRGEFWPIWVALVALIPLLRNGWRLYGPAPQFDRVERELEVKERREQMRGELRASARDQARAERRGARRGGPRR